MGVCVQTVLPNIFKIIMEHMKTDILRTHCLRMTGKIASSWPEEDDWGWKDAEPVLTTQGPTESAS